MAKLMVFGLDGIPWKFVTTWVDRWNLKNFKYIIKHGVYGKLISTIPSNTCPALFSLYTGKNPGNLGIFDFVKPDGSLVTYNDLKSLAFWDYLSQYGFKSCIVGTRLTYPVPKVNGVIIAGTFITKGNKKYLVYPESIWNNAKDFYPSESDITYYENIIKNPSKNLNKLYEFCRENLIRQINVFNNISKYDNYDFKFFWCGETDTLLHYSINNKDYIKKLMHEIDEILSEIRDENIFVISDHGFGTAAEFNFHLNEWLYREGYMKVKGGLLGRSIYVIGYNVAELILPDYLKKKILNTLRKLSLSSDKKKKEKQMQIDFVITPLDNIPGVDWDKSLAHVTTDKCWGIRIIKENLNRDYETLRDEIIQKLKQLRDPYGRKVIKNAWRGEDIYWGKYSDQIPDIIFLKEDLFKVRPSLVGRMFTKIKRKYGNYVGDHESAREGIFIACGEDICDSGKYIGEIQIYDVAPNILHLYGIPIPEDMDGKVINKIFKCTLNPPKQEFSYTKKINERMLITNTISKLKTKF